MTKKHRKSSPRMNNDFSKMTSGITDLAALGIVSATSVNMTAQITDALKKP